MVSVIIPQWSKNRNQKTTQEPTYIPKTISEINNTKEMSESTFPIIFKIIGQYQRKYTSLMAELKTDKEIERFFVD